MSTRTTLKTSAKVYVECAGEKSSSRRLSDMKPSFLFLFALLVTIGCQPAEHPSLLLSQKNIPEQPIPMRAESIGNNCDQSILLAPKGDTRVDREISRLQREFVERRDPERALERLGWFFVVKGRISFD